MLGILHPIFRDLVQGIVHCSLARFMQTHLISLTINRCIHTVRQCSLQRIAINWMDRTYIRKKKLCKNPFQLGMGLKKVEKQDRDERTQED